ncbi:radical SAM protein [Mycobacterium sp. SMC-2]|uniref:radical SAM/SPASM domain-containing protein n=1 Tax=Mycobacterium sp. SMC-2 TaxID=2857058 RepID=UPI0021B173DA|nr:radical SAM protein [Mycobacterium sp. SMC-2]UXA04447.1 radical SAM protein [Mycobacterium sp. SMC-2]
MTQPTRLPSAQDWTAARPVYVVWELTLACNQRCGHCGSRAAAKRSGELTLDECRDVIGQLAALGTREITLIGGEAYLRRDWVEVVRAISEHGILATLQTGGLGLHPRVLDAAIGAGLRSVGISIDGPDDVHNELRGVPRSAISAWRLLTLCRERGLQTTVNTTVTPRSLPRLEEMFERLIQAGVSTWQVGINVAMGRAADDPALLLQPYELLDLVPRLATLARAGQPRGLAIMPGNTMGYFGPDEALLRHGGDARMHWTGCNAGRNGMGLESDGTLKACPSLPRDGYAAGNVRELPIEQLWQHDGARYLRTRTVDDLWGFCRTCVYAADCLAGCTWVGHSFLGRPGNNPYCHHRALMLQQQGLRERVQRVSAPLGEPFDMGEFILILEPADGRGPGQVEVPPPWSRPDTRDRSERPVPRKLTLCPDCGQYSDAVDGECLYCGCDLAQANIDRARHLAQARQALVRLRKTLDESSWWPEGQGGGLRERGIAGGSTTAYFPSSSGDEES